MEPFKKNFRNINGWDVTAMFHQKTQGSVRFLFFWSNPRMVIFFKKNA